MTHTANTADHATAAAIDTQFAELTARNEAAHRTIDQLLTSAHIALRDRRTGRKTWNRSDEDTEATIREKATEQRILGGFDIQEIVADLDAAHATIKAVAEEWAPLVEIYRAAPWSRFFLVEDGHIHSSQCCSSCRVDTTLRWLPELSGLTEADAVAAYGERLCTICFPDAPVAAPAPKVPARPVCSGVSQLATGIRWVGEVRKGTCSCCGQVVRVKHNGRPYSHKPAA